MDHQWEYDDVLRAQFTNWLNTVIFSAKLNYLRQEKKKMETVSIEALLESRHPFYEESWNEESSETPFDFEEKRLADAFKKLPDRCRQILTMLFAEEKKPEEIARILNTPVRYIYNQRYQALKKLRSELEKGGGHK